MHAKHHHPVRRKPASASAHKVTPEEAERVERRLELLRAQREERFALGLCDADGFATKAALLAMFKGTLAADIAMPKNAGPVGSCPSRQPRARRKASDSKNRIAPPSRSDLQH